MNTTVDNNEINRILSEYKDMIMRIAIHYLKNIQDSEDIIQDVLVKFIEKKPEFQNAEHEKFWFIRVTINLCKNKLHSFWKKKIVISNNLISSDNTAFPDYEVLDAVLSLSQNQRITVYLHYYEGYSLTEIANILNRSPNTVQTWHKQAKINLRKKLGDDINVYI